MPTFSILADARLQYIFIVTYKVSISMYLVLRPYHFDTLIWCLGPCFFLICKPRFLFLLLFLVVLIRVIEVFLAMNQYLE